MIFVGIDVASKKHDCCIIGSDGEVKSAFTIKNNRDDFDRLMSEIKKFSRRKDFSDVKAGLESTGHYHINITEYLQNKRLSVKIYNPLQVSLFRKGQSLRKTKTDKSDSKFLATLLMTEGSKPCMPRVCPHSELKIQVRSRQRLIKLRSRLKVSVSRLVTVLFPELFGLVYSINQKSTYALLLKFSTANAIANADIRSLAKVLHDNSHGKYGKAKAETIKEAAKKSIGLDSAAMGFELCSNIRMIQNIQSEIDLIEVEIKKTMRELNSPILTIPGIGFILGAIILAEYGDFSNFSNPNQLLKFAGLEPSVYESGNYKADRVKMVKRGSPYLRWALLEAARLAAIRDNVFRDYMLKKVGEGKHFYVARSHVARKLVRVIFSLIKNDQIFDRELSLSAA